MNTIRVGLIGCGGIALANHVPGLALCPDTPIAALCDTNPAVLESASRQTGVAKTFTDPEQLLRDGDVDAVIVATPNVTHAPIVHSALAAGKHVLCEKPIAMNAAEANSMWRAAEQAGVRHMTAFTYRFVPGMRYIGHLVAEGAIGQPYHFRAQRFQDWGDRYLGWRQVAAAAGTGELGDMLSHRLDFGHYLCGPIRRVTARLKRFVPTRGGAASELDDWVAVLAEFENEATGVLESSKLCSGRGEGGRSHDLCEINGSEGTLVYRLGQPLEVLRGRRGASGLEAVPVPPEFRVWPGSPRDPNAGDPLVVFRYDQDFEFIDAIRNRRPCVPSLREGAHVQAVMDAICQSSASGNWTEVFLG